MFSEFRALDRRVWTLAAARLVVTTGFSMVLPFLAIHLTAEREVPAFVVGMIWTIAGACGAATQWLAGELSDRVGRRSVMLAAMILRATNLAGLGYATAVDASVTVIGALCVTNAVLRSFFDPVANAMVADLAPPEQRVAAFSLQRVGVNIGWAAGPAVHALAADLPFSTLFYASVPVTLLATVGVAALYDSPTAPSTPSPKVGWRELLAFKSDKAFVRFLAATVAFFILQVQLYQTLSIYAARFLDLTRAQVGTLYTLNGLLVVALQIPAVRAIRRLGTRGALIVGCVGYAAGYAAAGLVSGHPSLLLCVAFVTLAEIVAAPAQQATVTGMAPLGRMGAYSGLFGFCQIVGQSAGPLIGTTALDVMPPRLAWLALAAFGLAAAVGYGQATKVVAPMWKSR